MTKNIKVLWYWKKKKNTICKLYNRWHKKSLNVEGDVELSHEQAAFRSRFNRPRSIYNTLRLLTRRILPCRIYPISSKPNDHHCRSNCNIWWGNKIIKHRNKNDTSIKECLFLVMSIQDLKEKSLRNSKQKAVKSWSKYSKSVADWISKNIGSPNIGGSVSCSYHIFWLRPLE